MSWFLQNYFLVLFTSAFWGWGFLTPIHSIITVFSGTFFFNMFGHRNMISLMSENSHIYEYMIKRYLAIRVVYLLLFPFNFIKNIKYILQVSQCQNPTFFCICSNQQKAFWQQVQGSRIFDYMVKISMLLFLALLFTFLYYNYDIKINNVLMASCDKFCSKGLTNLCMCHFVLIITLWSTY